MSRRMQITLTDEQYETLERERERTGSTLAELTRRAVSAAYRPDARLSERLRWLEEGFGAWAERGAEEDPLAELRRLRPPLGPPPPAG